MFRVIMPVVLCLLLSACNASTSANTPAQDGATPTSKPSGTKASGPPCSQEIALECPAGQTDGCLKVDPDDGATTLTSVHVCVEDLERWEDYSPLCEQEIALECPTGMKDACLLSPPPSAVHVCITM